MKAKLIYTENALPIILEALNLKEKDGNINGIPKEKILGFQKDLGIIHHTKINKRVS